MLTTLGLLTLSLVPAAAGDTHSLTIYSSAQPGSLNPRHLGHSASDPFGVPGYAIVRTTRRLDIPSGQSMVYFTDVAAGIDPTTVRFSAANRPDTRVLEQDYRYDLVSTHRLLERYLGREIVVDVPAGQGTERYRGVLVASPAHGSEIVLQLDDGGLLSIASAQRNIQFPTLPEGLLVEPTLQWKVAAPRGGAHEVQVSYETAGMSWTADYNLVYSDARDCRLDLNAWVTLANRSGASYLPASVKLVAGDVNRAPTPQVRQQVYAMEERIEVSAAAPAFTEKAFFEYHLYTLDRPVDLPDRSIKQLELFPQVDGIPCTKRLRFDAGYAPYWRGGPHTQAAMGTQTTAPVSVSLSFQNESSAGMGMPLPRGRVRVSQRDPADDSLEFIGEDTIDHTPAGEELTLKIGEAFDVVGERRQVNYRWNRDDGWAEETMEIELRNRKAQPVTVLVRESLYRWTNWEVKDASQRYRRLDANTIGFEVRLDPDETRTVRYTARYDW